MAGRISLDFENTFFSDAEFSLLEELKKSKSGLDAIYCNDRFSENLYGSSCVALKGLISPKIFITERGKKWFNYDKNLRYAKSIREKEVHSKGLKRVFYTAYRKFLASEFED